MLDFGFLAFGLLRNLPFDRQRSAVPDFFESLKIQSDVYLPFAQRDFSAPGQSWGIAPSRVFAMDAANVFADFTKRFNRFAGTVENHVRRIEIDEQVLALGIADELQKCIGGFLSGFQVDRLFVLCCMIAKLTSDVDYICVFFAFHIMGNHTDVQTDDVTSQESGEVRNLLHFLEPRSAGLGRYQADGSFHGWDVCVAFSVKPTEDAREFNPIGIELFEESFSGGRCAAGGMRGMKLYRWDSQFFRHVQVHP